MKEYKLIPLNNLNVATTDSCAKESNPKPSQDGDVKVGGNQTSTIVNQILDNKEMDNHFKLILLNHFAQKIDNKMNENLRKFKDEDSSSANMNLFDIIKKLYSQY